MVEDVKVGTTLEEVAVKIEAVVEMVVDTTVEVVAV